MTGPSLERTREIARVREAKFESNFRDGPSDLLYVRARQITPGLINERLKGRPALRQLVLERRRTVREPRSDSFSGTCATR